VLVEDAASAAIALNAIRAAGATAWLIDPGARPADIAARLNACGARLLISSAPLAELAAEGADRSRVRQIIAFGEAAGATPFSSLLEPGRHDQPNQHPADRRAAANRHGVADEYDLAGEYGLADEPGRPGTGPELTYRDVVVAAPPCGDGHAYLSLLDLILLTGATLVAAPLPLVTKAIRIYTGTAVILPRGTHVPGVPADRVFAVALPRLARSRLRSPVRRGGTAPPGTADRAGPASAVKDAMASCCCRGTGSGAGLSLLVLMRVMMTSKLHTLRMAAKPNAAAMPCVSTYCGRANGVSAASGWLAACLLAVPNTATSTPRPSAPPTSCSMFTRPDAAPESAAGTPASDAVVSGTKTRPIPRPSSSIGPKMPDQ